MHCSPHFVARKRLDHAFDLPPVTEVQQVADVTAAFRPCGGFERGVGAEAIHEFRGLGESEAACDEGRIHSLPLTRSAFRDARQRSSTGRSPWLQAGLEATRFVCHGRSMAKSSPMAGGFFLMAAILIGAVGGVAGGNPMKGILIGTGIGALIAVAIWLLDRKSRRN